MFRQTIAAAHNDSAALEHGSPVTLEMSSPRGSAGAMSELSVPPTLAVLPSAFASCFQARSYLTFQWLMLG
jgi:hypothetical protein